MTLPLFPSGAYLLHPWALLAIPLLIAVVLFRPTSQRIALASLEPLQAVPRSLRERVRPPLVLLFALTALISLTIAAARPVTEERISDEQERRNLILALDISRSMASIDFSSPRGTVSRLAGVKQVVTDFLGERTEDRIGLVVFGAQAFLQAPLTLDHKLLQQLASTLDVGLAGEGTALGDGLGLALQRMEKLKERSRAVILITDGVNTAGHIQPLKAAEVASQLGITVHTIGIGSSEGATVNMFGIQISRSARPGSEFDEETLRRIANQTGGIYRNANSVEGLTAIYEEIDSLEQSKAKEQSATLIHEHFSIFATGGLIALLLLWLVDRWLMMKVP